MIAAIEDGIVAAVKAASLGYALGNVGSYGGELAGDDNAMAQVIRQFPCVWVTFLRELEPEPYTTAKLKWVTTATFGLLVATKSARGERFTRHNVAPNVEVGAYQIIEDLRVLLLNQDLGLAIAPLMPGRVQSLFNKRLLGQTVAVFQVELKCKYMISAPAGTDADWLKGGFNYYLQSTSEAAPDASDLIIFP